MTLLHLISLLSLSIAIACAAWIAFDETRRSQMMKIMNLVWPLCALFGSLIWLWFYLRWGRAAPKGAKMAMREQPFAVAVAKGASHCGAGCTLGDIVAETLALGFPAIALTFGWHSVFAERIFAVWVFDFLIAFGLGIVFQYFSIAPMRHLSFWPGLWAAIKADTLSLTAWQVGMYGFMAIAHFWIFGAPLGVKLTAAMPEFWFMMQIAMLCGFVTAYPVNLWLIKIGWKEKM
ncbi:MAG: DUF4396 domain-containing protein [Asticcacaulis sp.]|uniref:DUF4396 domain-containing protein n=1 Tax=Asticcacaulis sp. TaxID=1872648 RepID=UPI003F7CC1CB